MRKVTIYSNKTRATQEINTDVATWGELKALISEDMMVSNARCMVKENRMTLESAQAVLPTGDFIVYVYPTKVKSGVTEDAYTELTDAKLRKACQKKSLSNTGSGSSLRSKIRAYDKRHNIDSSEATAPKTNKNNVRPTTMRIGSDFDIENAPINILEDDYIAACPFDSLLLDDSSGAIAKDVDVLAKDAENLAKELGILLED